MSGNITALIEKIITSTPNTLRTLLIVLLLIITVVGGLWLLRADVSVGPVSITGRQPAATPRQPCLAGASLPAVVEEAPGACGR
jgi:hypothetical protein